MAATSWLIGIFGELRLDPAFRISLYDLHNFYVPLKAL
jgi:hypothetical protein